MKKIIGSLSVIFIFISFTFQIKLIAQASGYKIVKTIPIGGETRWDYLAVDNTYHRLFVSHSSSVAVINIADNKLISEIQKLNGVHGIAFAPEFNKGFISNGRDSSVTIFNLKTLKVLSNIKVTGRNPDAILYDPFTKRIFTMNGGSGSTTAIDAKTNNIVGTLKLDGKPEFAVSDLAGKVFVNIEDKSEIQEFDAKNLKVLHTWSIAPGEEPSGLAIDLKHNRLYSVCRNELMVVLDSKSGKIIKTLPIGKGVDACAFDIEDQLIFSSNGEGNITIIKEISPDNYEIIDNVKTEKGARTMAFDDITKNIYTDAALNGEGITKNFTVLVLSKVNKK